MRADADLSLPGMARLVAEFLDRLDLHDVTLVGNDTGGALVQLLMCDGAARVGQVVLASCDAFDNFPPGLTGKTLVLTGKLPPRVFGLFMQQMRIRPVRRLPIAFGWLTKRGDAATARWMKPVMQQPEIRRDAVRTLRAAASDADFLLGAAERLPGFDRPALVVWASEDRVELQGIRALGVGYDRDKVINGLGCIAAPILGLPRRCSGVSVRSTSDLTAPSAHNSASVSSNSASARAVRQSYKSVRNRDNTGKGSTRTASSSRLTSRPWLDHQRLDSAHDQPKAASLSAKHQNPRLARRTNRGRGSV